MLFLDISLMNIGVHTPLYKKHLHPTISDKSLAMEVMHHLIGLAMVAGVILLSAMIMLQWDTDMVRWDGHTVLELVAIWIELEAA